MPIDSYNPNIGIMILALNIASCVALSLILILYIISWRRINNFPLRLVFYLCLACLFQNIYVFIMSPLDVQQYVTSQSNTPLCKIDGVLKTTFDLSSIIWTLLIVYAVFGSVVRKINDFQKTQGLFLGMGFVFPFLVGLVPLIFNGYGFSVYYCWFSFPNDKFLQDWLELSFYYIPLWTLFLANLVLIVITLRYLRQYELEPSEFKQFKRLLIYPLLLFITAAFATAQKIDQLANNQKQQTTWVATLNYFFFSTYGFFNAIAFALHPVMKRQIYHLLRRDGLTEPIRESRTTSQYTSSSRGAEREMALEQF